MFIRNDQTDNQFVIKKYKNAIFKFEKYLEEIYSKKYNSTQYEEGYIINL